MTSKDAANIHHDFQDAQQSSADPFTDDDIRDITDALRDGDTAQVREFIDDLSTSESAELLQKVVTDDREELINTYLKDFDSETFVKLDDDLRKTILEKYETKASGQHRIRSRFR